MTKVPHEKIDDLSRPTRECHFKTEDLVVRLGHVAIFVLQSGPLPVCKWSYNPYKWPYTWVTGVITSISGVITLLKTEGYPQNTPKWSFLVGKPMVVGYHHFWKHPYDQPKQCLCFFGKISQNYHIDLYCLIPPAKWVPVNDPLSNLPVPGKKTWDVGGEMAQGFISSLGFL